MTRPKKLINDLLWKEKSIILMQIPPILNELFNQFVAEVDNRMVYELDMP